ncbi:hypothetical protein [Olivibacter domesticus]|uniref:Uncharacterized protein n=1 Tax=Olivibacter domesticus TaxID=407022 RepID=A0A1H7ZD91_OLID1|nr:hypothetical protein [Olivibacter domesticus]SEM56286.1 hypothetical protein SAMN05661044_05501 [Olivibacter domesticus]
MSKFHTFTSPDNLAVIINLKKITAIVETHEGKSTIFLDNGHNISVNEDLNSIRFDLDSNKQ